MTAVQSSLADLLGLSLASHRPFRASLPATPPVEDLPLSTAHFLPAARALVDYSAYSIQVRVPSLRLLHICKIVWAGFRSLLHHIA